MGATDRLISGQPSLREDSTEKSTQKKGPRKDEGGPLNIAQILARGGQKGQAPMEKSDFDRSRIEIEQRALAQSNSKSTHMLFKATELAERLRDPEPHFCLWALQRLPEARIEALVALALERGQVPAKYFNRLVQNELK